MTDAPAATDHQQFITRLQRSLDDGSFVRLLLGRPHGQAATLHKLLARRVVLRGQDHLALVWRHATQDITKNLPLADAVALVAEQVAPGAASGFHHAHLQTRQHDIQLAMGKKGRWSLRVGKLAPAPAEAESAEADDDAGNYLGGSEGINRQRRHPLTLDLPFLQELGVTDARAQLVPAMARKWRQINKFVEVLGHAIAESPLAQRDPAQPVRVLDFGAGKGYLTFAVHHHLKASGRVPDVTGVELRTTLTEPCNAIVDRLGLQGLRFDAGDVRSHGAQATDIMIALHACDTATDVALHRGVTAGAAVILASPCCHRELRPQLATPPVLAPLLRHGIHQATTAEMLTDALRAQLLEIAGYDTRVFEFISPEATSKNRMLLAVRRATPLPRARQQQLREELAALKALFGIRQQTLEILLADGASTAPVAAG
ncbi:MAG TPA: SAM-dependent methyltransferase [Aquabacterium sp.]|nr:SAM-dependent methyltransferase [Aquabacterium sp.]